MHLTTLQHACYSAVPKLKNKGINMKTINMKTITTIKNLRHLAAWVNLNLTPEQLIMTNFRSNTKDDEFETLFYNRNECGSAGCLMGWSVHAFDVDTSLFGDLQLGLNFWLVSRHLFPALPADTERWADVFGSHLSDDKAERVKGLLDMADKMEASLE